MTDKERLNLLKNDVYINAVNNGMKRTTIGYEEACWLIEQAERVQELEEEYKVRQIEYLEEHIDRLEKQNKRYREGIKLAMKKTDCDNTWDFLGRLLEGKEETDLPYRIGYKEVGGNYERD